MFPFEDCKLACFVLDAVFSAEAEDGSRRLALVVNIQGQLEIGWVPHTTTRFHLFIKEIINKCK